jgi:hypothetical protein
MLASKQGGIIRGSGLDENVTESASRGTPGHITALLRGMLSARNGTGVIACLALIIVSGIIAPGQTPGGWMWVRLLLAALFAADGLILIAPMPQPGARAAVSRRQPYVAIGCLFVAVVLSLTFNILSALFAVITLVLILLHFSARGPASILVFWLLLGTLVPFWVWSAFEAWDRWLLMLVPLGVVGVISLEHALRADLLDDAAERDAAWIGVLAMAAVWLIIGLIIDAELWWLIAGAVIAGVMAALDLVPARRRFRNTLPTFTLPGLALVALLLAWLIAL